MYEDQNESVHINKTKFIFYGHLCVRNYHKTKQIIIKKEVRLLCGPPPNTT